MCGWNFTHNKLLDEICFQCIFMLPLLVLCLQRYAKIWRAWCLETSLYVSIILDFSKCVSKASLLHTMIRRGAFKQASFQPQRMRVVCLVVTGRSGSIYCAGS